MAWRRFALKSSCAGPSTPDVLTPFYEQTADFTCGSACLLMALARFRSPDFLDPVWEIRLWREATTVFMLSGPGGCEPFGLAMVAREHGLDPEVWCSTGDLLFLETVRDPEKRRVMELAQMDFRAAVSDAGNAGAHRGIYAQVAPRKRLAEGHVVHRSGQWLSDDGQEGPALGARPWR
jgi:hypothetical protein